MNAPQLVILFGSHARKTAGKQSDTDIAVLASSPLSLAEKNALTAHLAVELQVNEERIDIVDLFNAPPLLAHQVGETGKLLHGTLFDFNRFRIRAWKQYLDTTKFRRAREQALKKYVQRTHS